MKAGQSRDENIRSIDMKYGVNKVPYVSDMQRRAMYAAAAGKSTLGIPKKVGQDFVAAGPAKPNLPKRAPANRKSYPPLSSLKRQ